MQFQFFQFLVDVRDNSLTCWVKFQQSFEYFSYFSKKIEFDILYELLGFDISCKFSLGDNLHLMSNPVF